LDELRKILMDKGLDIVKNVGLEPPEDFSYGAIVKLCSDALIKYINNDNNKYNERK